MPLIIARGVVAPSDTPESFRSPTPVMKLRVNPEFPTGGSYVVGDVGQGDEIEVIPSGYARY